MTKGPREINVPYRPIPLELPDGMKANEFYNSTENLNDLVHNNGLLQNPENLLMCGEASLDATWPLTSPGVPSIRMLHNHFIVFDQQQLQAADLTDPNSPNLTDGGQHSLFESTMHNVYHDFFDALDLDLLTPADRAPAGGAAKIDCGRPG